MDYFSIVVIIDVFVFVVILLLTFLMGFKYIIGPNY